MIYTRRVYDTAKRSEGKVFLVDRMWPRGIKKEDLKIDGWLKEAAPSTGLRKRFHQHPEQWKEFEKLYFGELDNTPETAKPLLEAARKGDITLLYTSRDTEHNNAVALQAYLQRKLENSDTTANDNV